MKFRGHNLCWTNFNPNWLKWFKGSEHELDMVLKEHITKVMQGVKEKAGGTHVYAWDVVNEAVSDSCTGDILKHADPWSKLPDYIDKAFTYARAADPHTLLFYNDYGPSYSVCKNEKTIEMIKGMQKRKVPIDGMGIQFHQKQGYGWSRKNISDMIKSYGDLGLKVHITEIDVECPGCGSLDWNHDNMQQATVYRNALQACVEDNPGVCTAFLSWGITDKYTFLGTNKHPLPFDTNYKKKPAYQQMQKVLQGVVDSPDLFLQ